MYFPEEFDDEDEYDSEDDPSFYEDEDYYHHHGFDDLYDDVGEDYDDDIWQQIHDHWFYVQVHEMFLYEYSPEAKEAEDSTVLDVLKVADMTIKLVDALKLRLGSEESDRFQELAVEVSIQLGGEKVEQLHMNAKEAKRIAMKSLRKSLAEVLPWSLEEHIMDIILGHLDLMDEEANESWKLETAEEEKPGLSSLYQHLSQIYSKIRTELFDIGNSELTPELLDPLQEVLSELQSEETTEEIEQEDDGGEIAGGNEDGDIEEDEEGDEKEEEDKGENQLEKKFEAAEEEKSSLSSQFCELDIKEEAKLEEFRGGKELENQLGGDPK